MIRDNKVLPRGDSLLSQETPKSNNDNIKQNTNTNTSPNQNVETKTEEQTTLLSQLDNKYIKEEFTGNSIFLGACFCPCLFLGHLESKVNREEPICACCLTSCPRVAFGFTGCQTCCTTGLLCSLGWPCSPCLTCYLNSRSTKVSNIYDRNIHRTCCDSPLFWPKTVLQHILLYEQLEKEGRLFYDWTLNADAQQSYQRDQFEMKDTAVLMVGGDNVGKTDLLMKLCHRNLYEKREKSFEGNEVRVGFRPMKVSNTEVYSLEFWDIPSLHLQSIHTIRATVTYVLLMFDVNQHESFLEATYLYHDVKEMTKIVGHAEFIVVAAKNDHLYYKTTAEGRWDADPNLETITKATEWANDHNLRFLTTATPFNIGINEILKIAQRESEQRHQMSSDKLWGVEEEDEL